MILSATVGTNADIFPKILQLYVPKHSVVADVTFGRGVFWRKVQKGAYRMRATDLKTGTDFRTLPYRTRSIDALVLDPPYMHGGARTVKKSLDEPYNVNARKEEGCQEILELYFAGVREAYRVLKPKGILVVKCQDQIESGKQWWFHKMLMNLDGFTCVDLFILVQPMTPISSHPHWTKQYHARKNHSYFLVHRKG